MYRKTLSAGASGGLVFTRDLELHHRALACADRGKPIWRSDYDFRQPSGHLFPALNWNTDELSCAIGLASVRRLDAAIAARMRFVRSLEAKLEARSRACRAYDLPDGASPFFLPIWVDVSQLTCDKRTFAAMLQAEGIDLNPHYTFLIQDWTWAAEYVPSGIHTPEAIRTRDTSFNLFLNEKYGEAEAEDVVAAIEKVESAFSIER
jgi:dTDP-4-amino-4,6-dideoxygalactose transaminase